VSTLDVESLVEELRAEGFDLLQRGRILRTPAPGVSFADRAEGCDVSRIRSGDRLIDDAERWAHLRRSQL